MTLGETGLLDSQSATPAKRAPFNISMMTFLTPTLHRNIKMQMISFVFYPTTIVRSIFAALNISETAPVTAMALFLYQNGLSRLSRRHWGDTMN
jgi:hypothetical protein